MGLRFVKEILLGTVWMFAIILRQPLNTNTSSQPWLDKSPRQATVVVSKVRPLRFDKIVCWKTPGNKRLAFICFSLPLQLSPLTKLPSPVLKYDLKKKMKIPHLPLHNSAWCRRMLRIQWCQRIIWGLSCVASQVSGSNWRWVVRTWEQVSIWRQVTANLHRPTFRRYLHWGTCLAAVWGKLLFELGGWLRYWS